MIFIHIMHHELRAHTLNTTYLNCLMTKYIARSFDDGNVSGVVEHFEHDGAVELSRGVLAELQLYQALGVQRLARARVHLVLLDEWQDVQEVKNMALSEKIKSTVKSTVVCLLYGMDLNNYSVPHHHNMGWQKAAG